MNIFIDLTDAWQGRPVMRRKKMKDGTIGEGIAIHTGKMRRAASIDRIILHHWGSDVDPASDTAKTWKLLNRERPSSPELRAALLLAARTVGTPYQYNAGVAMVGKDPIGVFVKTWPDRLYTNHAGTQNAKSKGIGLMASFAALASDDATRSPEWLRCMASAGFEALKMAAGDAAPMLLRTHSQSAAKPRDPGEWAVKAIVMPAVEFGLVRIEPDWHAGTGSVWIPAWR